MGVCSSIIQESVQKWVTWSINSVKRAPVRVSSKTIYQKGGAKEEESSAASFLEQLCMFSHNLLHHWRISQRGDVAEFIWLISCHLAQDSTHDLARTCLRKARSDLQSNQTCARPLQWSDTAADSPASSQAQHKMQSALWLMHVAHGWSRHQPYPRGPWGSHMHTHLERKEKHNIS